MAERAMTEDALAAFHTALVGRLGPEMGKRLLRNEPLARYTAARIGGPADALLQVHGKEELAEAAEWLWSQDLPFLMLGGGSNVLVSDAGVRGVVILNRARRVRFEEEHDRPQVWAESGVNFGRLARQAAQRGLAGLAWAAGIPGTVGGAVVGNAGAHGGDMTRNLQLAEILHRMDSPAVRRETWPAERLEYGYRTSRLKREPGRAVVLDALLRLERSSTEEIQAEMERYLQHRRTTQPPGASMGSMFKNPPGDYAGRLIEAAGLKGARRGEAQISELHANFFVNLGQARAADVAALIELARRKVAEKFGLLLELEIEPVGEWEADQTGWEGNVG